MDGLQGVAFLSLELVFSGGRGGWASGCGVTAPYSWCSVVGEVNGLQGVAFLPLELVFSGGRGGWASGCGFTAPYSWCSVVGEVNGLQGVAFLPPRAAVQWWERWMGFRVWRSCP